MRVSVAATARALFLPNGDSLQAWSRQGPCRPEVRFAMLPDSLPSARRLALVLSDLAAAVTMFAINPAKDWLWWRSWSWQPAAVYLALISVPEALRGFPTATSS